MILDENSVTIFKNFATINKSLEFKAGTKILGTISESKLIRAQATMGDQWEIINDFAIFDLNKLLAVISLAGKSPTITQLDKQLSIKGTNGEFFLTYSNPEYILRPKKPMAKINPSIKFHLPEAALTAGKNAASILSHQMIAFVGNGKTLAIESLDPENPTSDRFTNTLTESDASCNVLFHVDNIKMIPQDYNVEIDPEGIASFTGQAINVKYYVATHISSTFA